ncbi:nuclear transport factor 2 family protein [Belliella kenyensis]|uniref:Nuclear transport factor 2 family protein n=1 Tax=Belliella kenyensis TaxID=1472724 RepID=A0ABV8EIX0_9BACT|nr:nuclear transport factor 2 family protein [Belliella kenyensis]MCH7401270.1 nuclear transport factor 2 family protein [Belliella kenyensis]MDN3602715.1 nuclear transport factor 2 family protein [Belliella kenyensis]
MKKLFLILLTLSLGTLGINAQTDDEAIKATISSLFEGMKTKDQALIESAFHPQAVMHTASQNESGTMLGSNSVNDFINRIATTPVETIIDERILQYEINIDDKIAQAWTPYEFYVNDNFSHCGVNAFSLIKTSEGWKITYVIDTRRKENCK